MSNKTKPEEMLANSPAPHLLVFFCLSLFLSCCTMSVSPLFGTFSFPYKLRIPFLFRFSTESPPTMSHIERGHFGYWNVDGTIGSIDIPCVNRK